MVKFMETKTGYSTTTYKMQLYQKHFDWLVLTKDLYNEVLAFYYQILLTQTELLVLSSYSLLRELEKLTIGTKEDKKNGILPKYSLERFPKLPLYFRRAAINAAISMAKSYTVRLEQWKRQSEKLEEGLKKQNKGCPKPASCFHASPLFYQGMYRNFTSASIELKLWNGTVWKWVRYPFKGREFPEHCELLSPCVKLYRKRAELHIPVVTKVEDIRNIKERLDENGTLCAVFLPGQDTMAVCALMDTKGILLDTCFIKGGAELARRKNQLLSSWKHAKKKEPMPTWIREKIHAINEAWAHKISRQIVDFAVKHGALIIVVPSYQRAIPARQLWFGNTSPYDWIGRNILQKTDYKAFREGIVMGTVSAANLTRYCSHCGAEIKRYNEGKKPGKNYYGGQLFVCPNGHQGNSALNAAKNIGIGLLKRYSAKEYISVCESSRI